MANTSSAKKSARKIAARTEINKSRTSRMRTFIRKVEEAIAGGKHDEAVAALKDKVLFEEILPPFKSEVVLPGSTDVGDVSWVVPTGQIVTTCWTLGSPGHSWQIVAQGKMGIGQRGMLYAGKVMAESALEFMKNDSLREKAVNEFKEKRAAANYVSPIPPGIKPPLNI